MKRTDSSYEEGKYSCARDGVNQAFLGNAIWGDDLTGAELQQWYEDEANAYFNLYGSAPTHSYEYHRTNAAYGFKYIRDIHFGRALGLGSGFGDEFEPLAEMISSLDIVESADAYLTDETPSWALNIPIVRHRAEVEGPLPLESETFDLALCLGVLHHIPNVTWHITELARVMRPGSYLLLREPIISMGDWRSPRPGLTPRERGIPRRLLLSALRSAGFSIVHETLLGLPPVVQLQHLLARGRVGKESPALLRLDAYLSRALRFNLIYHVQKPGLRKFRPTSTYLVLKKNAPVGMRS